MAPLCSIPELIESYLAEGRNIDAPPDLDPNRLNILAERFVNELDDAQAKDDTPALFIVPGAGSVTWQALLGALVAESYKRLAAKGARISQIRAPTDGIAQATQEAEAARRRLAQAIDGNHSNPRRSALLRERIFAARVVSRTKAGWEAELRTEIAAIRTLGDEAPVAVRDMLPLLEGALRTLDATLAAPTGRPPRLARWSADVVDITVALNLAIGDLLSSAASKATPRRNATLLKLATKKRREPARRDAAEEKKNEPAGDANGASSSAPSQSASETPSAENPTTPRAPSPEGANGAPPQTEPPPAPGPIASGAPESPASAAMDSTCTTPSLPPAASEPSQPSA